MDGAERDSALEPLKTDSPLHLERIGHPNLIASPPNSAEDPERGCLPPADQESNYAPLDPFPEKRQAHRTKVQYPEKNYRRGMKLDPVHVIKRSLHADFFLRNLTGPTSVRDLGGQ